MPRKVWEVAVGGLACVAMAVIYGFLRAREALTGKPHTTSGLGRQVLG